MQTLLVDLILAAAVGVVFLIARQSKNWGYMPRLSQRGGENQHWLNFLVCSGVGQTTTRRIGQAPRINEATGMNADDLQLNTARQAMPPAPEMSRPLLKFRPQASSGPFEARR